MCLLQLEFIVDMGFILWVEAIVGFILDLISLFNILASTCLACATQTSIYKTLQRGLKVALPLFMHQHKL